MIYRNSEKV